MNKKDFSNQDFSTIKLIASDLDGTLLLNGAQELAPGTAQLIDAVSERGIIFAAASGRQYPTLRNLFADVHHDICYMCFNGGLCAYRGNIFYEKDFSRQEAEELFHDIYNMDGCEVMVSTPEYENLIPKDMGFVHIVRDIMKSKCRMVRNFRDIEGPILKVAAYREGGLDPEFWRKRYGNRFAVQASGTLWLDICPKGVDKGSGIHKVAEYFNIPLENIMAFGDNDNDIPMLSDVGLPVAMDDGIERVKELAGRTTPTVESVLRKLLGLQ